MERPKRLKTKSIETDNLREWSNYEGSRNSVRQLVSEWAPHILLSDSGIYRVVRPGGMVLDMLIPKSMLEASGEIYDEF